MKYCGPIIIIAVLEPPSRISDGKTIREEDRAFKLPSESRVERGTAVKLNTEP